MGLSCVSRCFVFLGGDFVVQLLKSRLTLRPHGLHSPPGPRAAGSPGGGGTLEAAARCGGSLWKQPRGDGAFGGGDALHAPRSPTARPPAGGASGSAPSPTCRSGSRWRSFQQPQQLLSGPALRRFCDGASLCQRDLGASSTPEPHPTEFRQPPEPPFALFTALHRLPAGFSRRPRPVNLLNAGRFSG